MAGAGVARQSRRRTKPAAAADTEAAAAIEAQRAAVAAATNLPLPSFNFATKEALPTRTVAASRAKALKEKNAAADAAAPAAKKNLQGEFQDSCQEIRKSWEFFSAAKVFLLLFAAAGISTTLLSLRESDQGQLLPETPTAAKVSEVEDFMRKTSKWLQVQLDVVDDKIGKEVSGVRSELEEKLSERTRGFEKDIGSIKAQVQKVDNSLKMLYSQELLSREETLELVKSAMDQRAREGSDKAISLDDVRAAARKVVQSELETHAADGIGRVDFALESGGGKVVHHSDGYFQGLHWTRLGIHVLPGVFRRHPMADRLLRPSFGEPGQCLPLKGSNVTVDIRLRAHIFPEAVTLEHLSKKVAYDPRSAPRDFEICAWRTVKDDVLDARNVTSLGRFTYDLEKGSIQTFDLSDKPTSSVNMIRLHVLSNYGSPTHTCLYRLRVHGTEDGVMA
ncbi:SUN domain-containing protein 1 [Selaginella moellendorffii]|nr:SUN domain-containing protein 1 [Selaginella moellendorffii]|eukprot:XP_002988787.2 SUN domain-containing protein 1 [Selaginella moellendorffii]